MANRKTIGEKKKLEVLKRDNFKCVNCGKSPAIDSLVILEVDHIIPHSKGGTDDVSNLRTLCRGCNRGKGNDEGLNKVAEDNVISMLNKINPSIITALEINTNVSVVANVEDYSKLVDFNGYCKLLKITPSTNTIFGFQAARNLGIYTVNDNSGAKVHFFISYNN